MVVLGPLIGAGPTTEVPSDGVVAAGNEIEITPAMLRVGMVEFYKWKSDEYGDAECAVSFIFRAMIAAS